MLISPAPHSRSCSFSEKEFRYSAPGSPGCRNKINANPAKCKGNFFGFIAGIKVKPLVEGL